MPAITPPRKTYVRQRAVLPPDRHTLQFSFYIPLHFQYFYFLNLLLSAIQRFYFTLFSHNYSLIADNTMTFSFHRRQNRPLFRQKKRNILSRRHFSYIPIPLYSLVSSPSYTSPILFSISPSISSAAIHSPISIIPMTTIIWLLKSCSSFRWSVSKSSMSFK